MHQYIATHDGDYWIMNTENPITLLDIVNDKNAILTLVLLHLKYLLL